MSLAEGYSHTKTGRVLDKDTYNSGIEHTPDRSSVLLWGLVYSKAVGNSIWKVLTLLWTTPNVGLHNRAFMLGLQLSSWRVVKK